jgi:hypothetical protein
MLSALDVELLEQWAQQAVPFEVVARGIRKAAERALWDGRPGEPLLRTLRACRKEVEREFDKHRARAVGKGIAGAGGQVEAERHRRLCSALRKLAKAHPGLEGAVGALLAGPLAHAPLDLRGGERQEAWAWAALCRALPFEVRVPLVREARRRATEAVGASARGRRMSRRFHREALVRRRLDVGPLW